MSRKRKSCMLQMTIISPSICLHHTVFTDKKSKPSDSLTFSLKAVIRDVETNVSVHIFEEERVEARHTILSRVKHSNFTTDINDILKPH